MRAVDLVGGAVLCVLSLALIFVIIPMDDPGGDWTGLSPYFFPIVIAGAIAFFSLALSVQAARQAHSHEDEDKAAPVKLEQLAMLLFAMALILTGVLAIAHLGVWIGGPFLIVAMMLFMGERNAAFIFPTAILPILVVNVLVDQFLGSPLP